MSSKSLSTLECGWSFRYVCHAALWKAFGDSTNMQPYTVYASLNDAGGIALDSLTQTWIAVSIFLVGALSFARSGCNIHAPDEDKCCSIFERNLGSNTGL